MTTFKKFEDLEVWQKSRSLTKAIYMLTNNDPFKQDYSLCDQVRRCAVSTMANIAEGFGRKSAREFAVFLNYTHGSAAELQSHLYIALDLDYIDQDQFAILYDECERVSKMSLRLQNYQRKAAF